MTLKLTTRAAALAAALAATGVAAVGVATAGQASSDANGNFAVADFDVSPPQAGSKATPRGVGLDVHYFAGNGKTGARIPYDGDVTVRLPRGMVSNAAVFPSKCLLPATSDQVGDESRCPKDAKVGTGTGELDGRPALQGPIQATINVYNGALRGKRPTFILMLLTVGDNPIRGELDLEYSNDPIGPYGHKLATVHPVVDPSAGLTAVRKLDLSVPNRAIKRKVGGKRVRTHLVDAPTKCSGTWEFALTVAARTGGGSLTATDAVGCVKAPSSAR